MKLCGIRNKTEKEIKVTVDRVEYRLPPKSELTKRPHNRIVTPRSVAELFQKWNAKSIGIEWDIIDAPHDIMTNDLVLAEIECKEKLAWMIDQREVAFKKGKHAYPLKDVQSMQKIFRDRIKILRTYNETRGEVIAEYVASTGIPQEPEPEVEPEKPAVPIQEGEMFALAELFKKYRLKKAQEEDIPAFCEFAGISDDVQMTKTKFWSLFKAFLEQKDKEVHDEP